MDETRQLAEFAVGLDPAQLPDTVRERVRMSVLDTLGCGVFGAQLPWCRAVQHVIDVPGDQGPVVVWGTSLRSSPASAAWANGTAGHSFELDDHHHSGGIHPGSLTLAAGLAAATVETTSGRDLMAAIVAGVEVAARIGRTVSKGHFRAGYHPQGTTGTFAAAVTAARLLGLDASGIQQAMGIVGSSAGGLMAAQEGAMVKRLHSGNAAAAGVRAALLAARGFTGIPDVLEAPFGGFVSTLGGQDPSPDELTAALGDRWLTEEIGFKIHAACAAVHTSLDVTRALRDQHGFKAADVRAVRVDVSTKGYLHCGWEYRPTGVSAAQMNFSYCIARMLTDGEVSVQQFTESAITEPAVLELASRVTVEPSTAIDGLGHDRRHTCEVTIDLVDGSSVSGRAEQRRGSHHDPVTPIEVEAKFRSVMEEAGLPDRADDVIELVRDLDGLADVRGLAEAVAA